MIQDSFENKVKVQDIINNQIPEFISSENPKFSEFLKQYYISQEIQGGNTDLVENLIEYIRLDNLNSNTLNDSSTLSASISSTDSTIYVSSTKGFPKNYGLIQIGSEIITYKSKTSSSFVDCIRGFSGVDQYQQEINFSSTNASSHNSGSNVINLSVLFLKEFYTKIKSSILPELDSTSLYSELNVNNFLKSTTSLYRSKGSKESIKILFRGLFGITPQIIDLEAYVIKASNADYLRRREVLLELLSDGNPSNLVGQQLQKTNDPSVFGSISELEIFTRNSRTFYKCLLYIGYDNSHIDYIDEFKVTPSTKVVSAILKTDNSNTISVDSTIGFPQSGSILYGSNEIFYTEKSINQFFGCKTDGYSYINLDISKTSIIHSNDTYFGYEGGDTSKKVEFRLLGNISDTIIKDTDDKDHILSEDEEILVGKLGKNITNTDNNNLTQIFSNSFQYNTSVRIRLSYFNKNGSTARTQTLLDKSFLKVGDTVEFLERNTEILNSQLTDVEIVAIDGQEITFSSNLSTLSNLKEYDIRRKLDISNSGAVPLAFDNITTNISNVYVEDDYNFYVASNSLPSYSITKDVTKSTASAFKNYVTLQEKYSTIELSNTSSFVDGDKVYYSYTGSSPIDGLKEGEYFVTIENNKDIKLYLSKSGIPANANLYYASSSADLPSGTHTFTLSSQKTSDDKLHPAKLLKKINLNKNYSEGGSDDIGSNTIGILANGVEILSSKSVDKIYYGPLERVKVINPGSGYDVINPPVINIEGTAKIQPVVQGSIDKVFVDPVYFDIEEPVSIKISGGNGKNASLKPVLKYKTRELLFNARALDDGGGLSYDDETITFLSDHNLYEGQKIIYSINELVNEKIGISTYEGPNVKTGYLANNQSFYVDVINSKTVKLYPTIQDYTVGINTVGFSTEGNFGIHKFRTESKRTLDSVSVLNPGDGFTNRKLIVKQSGISTVNDSINFKNHGFLSGEIVTYNYQTSVISGLSTSNQYYVLKIDNDSFRLCNAGVGGTDTSYYDREKYVSIESTGSGYQYFNYPNISVEVSYISGGNPQLSNISCTPVIKGSIIDSYLYEGGSNYGSTVLNVEVSPSVSILQGQEASLSPIISGGKIEKVIVSYGGFNFYSIPDLVVKSSTGIGAVLRAEISDGKITNVVVIDGGYNYTSADTIITTSFDGKNALLNPKVRALTVDNCYKYGTQYSDRRDPSLEFIYKNLNNQLQYVVCGYSDLLKSTFNESSDNHSPIIGWAYDGNPIYGPYGYTDPEKVSQIKQLKSGYTKNISNITNRPSGFELGYFIGDYKFDNSGDLDIYNGRWCKTPEFPEGTYAYFSSVDINPNNEIIGRYPYFIANNYRSKSVEINKNNRLNQSFDFESVSLLRNTFPYGTYDEYSTYDFYPSKDNLLNQQCKITSITKGGIESVEILSSGDGFKVNDEIYFDTDSSNGGYGLETKVSRIKGQGITSIDNSSKVYLNAKIYPNFANNASIVINPSHEIKNNTKVTVSGLTSSFAPLNGDYFAKVKTHYTNLDGSIPTYSAGIVTDIQLLSYPNLVSIGSSLKIKTVSSTTYDQYFTILNYYEGEGIVRCKKTGNSGLSTDRSLVEFLPNSFDIDSKSEAFNLKPNYKRYFNPQHSVGVGTLPGSYFTRSFYVGNNYITKDIPTQSIYIPNHGLKTGQKVLLERPSSGAASLLVGNDPYVTFTLLSSTEEEVYIINKSDDYIGIVTAVGLTTTSNGLYFPNNAFAGSDNFEYTINTLYDEYLCRIDQSVATVSISTYHNLKDNDLINLEVIPSQNVGIGNSDYINLKYISNIDAISVKELSFTPSDVDISQNSISITNHGLVSGDKVYYISTSTPSGISSSVYYVNKINVDTIKLSETFKDSTNKPARTVNISSQGIGTQALSLIQPEIHIIGRNNLVFDLSDSSLEGYNFNIYYDSDFKNEFVSSASTNTVSTFSVIGIGTVGVSTNASLTLKYDQNNPNNFYYTLVDSSLDKINSLVDSNSPSKISYLSSNYSGTYSIFNAQDETFDVYLNEIPEKNYYEQNDCHTLKYTTNSTNAIGAVEKISVTNQGDLYSDLPYYSKTNSANGKNLSVLAKSSKIGKLISKQILNSGFEYSLDPTLNPSLNSSQNCYFKDSYYLKQVKVLDGGKNYPSPPTLLLIDSTTKKEVGGGLITPIMSGSGTGNASISEVNIEVTPQGLSVTPTTVVAVNNSNGIRIDRVTSSTSGIMTCILKTPILGFAEDPFAEGDKVFIENIDILDGTGIGFNSKDHGYSFFDVISYTADSDPGEMVIKIPTLYGNPGIAVTFQIDTFASIIKSDNYPTFKVTQDLGIFIDGEGISIVQTDGSVVETDLVVKKSTKNYLKLFGDFEISKDTKIRGTVSGSIATIYKITNVDGKYDVSGTRLVEYGWKSDSGKLNLDTQFIPDNDYYQNLSYTIKSEKTWEEIKTPVNSIVHPIGTKNFADTQIQGKVSNIVGIGTTSESTLDIIQILSSQSRVDTIKNYDIVRDYDPTSTSSKFVEFANVQLSDFFGSSTNRVLNIDNISPLFSSSDDENLLSKAPIKVLSPDLSYYKLLVQIKSTQTNIDAGINHIQLSEIVTIHDGIDTAYFLEKTVYSNKLVGDAQQSYGAVGIEADEYKNYSVVFYPENPFDYDYEIKVLETTQTPSNITTEDYLNLLSSIILSDTTVFKTTDSSKNILSLDSSIYNCFVTESHVVDRTNNTSKYVELFGIYSGTGTGVVLSEFSYSADNNDLSSMSGIGTFNATIDGSSNLILSFENYTNSELNIKTKSYIFGDSTLGISTYKFKSYLQDDDSVRTVRIDTPSSQTGTSSGIVTVREYDSVLFSSVKTLARVSIGNTVSLHQVVTLHDGNNSFITEAPLVTIGSSIGAFRSSLSNNNLCLEFERNSNYETSDISISQIDYSFYSFLDEINIPLELNISNLVETQSIARYYGLNSPNINRLSFPLLYNKTPIFAKKFNPNNENILNPDTGVFTINDHFFNTGERLIYRPNSTFTGIGYSSMHIQASTDISGVTTTILPSDVFAIRIDNSKFKLASNYSNANLGIGVTFTYFGLGNSHELEMYKKNEKSLITINDLVQYPLAYTGIAHSLSDTDGNVGYADSFFNLSGISSISPIDILKIDDEYVKVLNVGIGTTSGVISYLDGDFNIVEVERGFFGSIATSHTNQTKVDIYRGSYNINGENIYFTSPPRGNIGDLVSRDERNLFYPRATFGGRVFLRKDYSTNQVFDDISNNFDGKTTDFNITRLGVSTIGISTVTQGGNGVVFINGIFQTPLTENIVDYNFNMIQDSNAGVTTLRFSGLRDASDDSLTISESDVNQNQLPRGGIIVSLGSTSGLGYAPLEGARVHFNVDVNGVIQNPVVSAATTGKEIGFSTVSYNNQTGVLSVKSTTSDVYKIKEVDSNQVKLVGLAFTCNSNPGVTSYFPSHNDPFDIIGIGTDSFTLNVGISTLEHYYVGFGTAYVWLDNLTFGSGYKNPLSYAIRDAAGDYVHKFVSADEDAVYNGSDTYEPVFAEYNPKTGSLLLSIEDHGLTDSDTVQIKTGSIIFTCSSDGDEVQIAYPRATDPVAGIATDITAYTTNSITVNVGSMIGSGANLDITVGAGGTLAFNVTDGGSGYVRPVLDLEPPTYENLEVIGVSRLSVGLTTQTGIGMLVNVEVGPAAGVSTDGTVGIGSTLFEVSSFDVIRSGYSFRRGDVLTVVGLVTASGLSEPVNEFRLFVLDTYSDNFSSWQFGELDLIDSIKPYQNGSRQQYPLYYNGDLISFQKNTDNVESESIDFNSLLVIFVNGILQEPGVAYEFNGGTSFRFLTAPKVEDDVQVYFYVGTYGEDSSLVLVNESIKPGDQLQIKSDNELLSETTTQDIRLVYDIVSTDVVETNTYFGQGIDSQNLRPVDWIKQKEDLVINEIFYSKSRDSLEPQIYPTAKVIGDFSSTDGTIYLDNAEFFDYEGTASIDKLDLIVVPYQESNIIGIITAIVSAAGTISSFDIVNAGFGYTSLVQIKVSNPFIGVGTNRSWYTAGISTVTSDVGIGTTATASLTIVNGSIESVSVVNPGSGYTNTNPPQVVIESPEFEKEILSQANVVNGLSGSIVGIATTTVSGTGIAIEFTLSATNDDFTDLSAGIPIYIFDTAVGTGLTTIDQNESDTIGISTEYLDCVYKIQSVNTLTGIITCNISNQTNIIGIGTTGTKENPVGKFSFGKISGFTRSSNPVSIAVTSLTVSGLSTYPTVQRRNSGLRDTGSLRK